MMMMIFSIVHLDHARELKKVWYIKLTVIPIVVGVFGFQRSGKETGKTGN